MADPITSVAETVTLRLKPLTAAILRTINWAGNYGRLGIALVIRAVCGFFLHTLYRLTVTGREHVPVAGGALLVCNAVSFIDHALVMSALHRPVRFFMGRVYYEHPLINPLARALRMIPIDSADNPKVLARSLLDARAAVEAGELVCIFAEGNITRTGNMLPFGRGMEFIMRGMEAPVIPMHLDRIWGSTFSFMNGGFSWRYPKVLPYPITVTFGAPLPSSTRVAEVRQSIQELSAEAFKLRGDSQKKLHITFIYEAKRHPFKFCIADSLGMRLNYAAALAGAFALSWKLFPVASVDADEKVGIMLPTSCGAVLANVAVMLAGKIPVNLNYTGSRETIDHPVRQCGMRTILTSRVFLEKTGMAAGDNMIFMEDLRSRIGRLTRLAWFAAVLLLPARLLVNLFVRGGRNIEDLATVIFSSGTTGEPKGVMLTHQNISSNVESAYQIFNIRDNDIFMGVLPFFHSFGYTATLWLPLTAGVSSVYHTNPLDAAKIGELTARFRATIILGTPTFLSAYARKCGREQFASLRFVVAGAEKLKRNTAEGFYQKFGVPPFEGYGTTELSPIVSLGIPGYIHPEGRFVQVGNKPGTVGHPIPGVAAKIVNPETYERLPAGEAGLLMIKGPNVMKGYLRNPGETARVIRGGWYATGDIASIDEDGFIAITDRLSRFSKIGGEMIPHIKIEEEIHEVLGCGESVCAVTAVPDDRKGERLVVLYAADIDVDAVWEGLGRRGLPRLWIPKKESFRRIEAIPLLGSGKLDIKKVKQLALELT